MWNHSQKTMRNVFSLSREPRWKRTNLRQFLGFRTWVCNIQFQNNPYVQPPPSHKYNPGGDNNRS